MPTSSSSSSSRVSSSSSSSRVPSPQDFVQGPEVIPPGHPHYTPPGGTPNDPDPKRNPQQTTAGGAPLKAVVR